MRTSQLTTSFEQRAVFKGHCKAIDAWCDRERVVATVYVLCENNLSHGLAENHNTWLLEYMGASKSTRFRTVATLPAGYLPTAQHDIRNRVMYGLNVTGLKPQLVRGIVDVVSAGRLRFLEAPVSVTTEMTESELQQFLERDRSSTHSYPMPTAFDPLRELRDQQARERMRRMHRSKLPLLAELMLTEMKNFMAIMRPAPPSRYTDPDDMRRVVINYSGKRSGGTDDMVCALMNGLYMLLRIVGPPETSITAIVAPHMHGLGPSGHMHLVGEHRG